MKHQFSFLFTIVLGLAACKEIPAAAIQGQWTSIPNGNGNPIFREINFEEGKIALIGDDLFKDTETYQVKNGVIRIQLDRDNFIFETNITHLEADSVLLFDSVTYCRNREIALPSFEAYELISFPTQRFLSDEKRFFDLIHFYKKNGKTKIRYGTDHILLDEINLALQGGHAKPAVLMYLGKGITLEDLRSIYLQIAAIGHSKIWLATKKEGIADIHIFQDELEVWWENIEKYAAATKALLAPLPPPPPVDLISKKNYLKNGGKEVRITAKKDLPKIDGLLATERYVVSISPNLEIEDYLELKQQLGKKRTSNKHIRTEIE